MSNAEKSEIIDKNWRRQQKIAKNGQDKLVKIEKNWKKMAENRKLNRGKTAKSR